MGKVLASWYFPLYYAIDGGGGGVVLCGFTLQGTLCPIVFLFVMLCIK